MKHVRLERVHVVEAFGKLDRRERGGRREEGIRIPLNGAASAPNSMKLVR